MEIMGNSCTLRIKAEREGKMEFTWMGLDGQQLSPWFKTYKEALEFRDKNALVPMEEREREGWPIRG
jgi:hypothetical protein